MKTEYLAVANRILAQIFKELDSIPEFPRNPNSLEISAISQRTKDLETLLSRVVPEETSAAPDLLAALEACLVNVQNGELPPSDRLELVRDIAIPALARAIGGVK